MLGVGPPRVDPGAPLLEAGNATWPPGWDVGAGGRCCGADAACRGHAPRGQVDGRAGASPASAGGPRAPRMDACP
eukprot:1004053-Alexandrium_andersonii.AAC.1